MIDATPSDKVSDIVREIPNGACSGKRDMYVTFEGKALRRSDKVKACGSKLRGRGKRKDKMSKAEEENKL